MAVKNNTPSNDNLSEDLEKNSLDLPDIDLDLDNFQVEGSSLSDSNLDFINNESEMEHSINNNEQFSDVSVDFNLDNVSLPEFETDDLDIPSETGESQEEISLTPIEIDEADDLVEIQGSYEEEELSSQELMDSTEESKASDESQEEISLTPIEIDEADDLVEIQGSYEEEELSSQELMDSTEESKASDESQEEISLTPIEIDEADDLVEIQGSYEEEELSSQELMDSTEESEAFQENQEELSPALDIMDTVDVIPDLPEEHLKSSVKSEKKEIQQLDEETVSLTDDELDDIISELPDEDFEFDGQETEQYDEKDSEIEEKSYVDQQETLSISDEELVEKIMPSTELETSEELYEDIEKVPLSQVSFDENDDMISLTPEELQEIVSSQDVEESNNQAKVMDKEELSATSEDDESIALTEDELNDILGSSDIQEENLTEISEKLSEELEIESPIDMQGDEEPLPEPILEEESVALTEEEIDHILEDSDEPPVEDIERDIVVPSPDDIDLTESRSQMLAEKMQSELGINTEELKKIISYLDSLFDYLPESVIREFSRSEYFNIYKKVIETLGIYPPEE